MPRPRIGEFDFAGRPDIALLYRGSGALMDLLGPMFWAALVVLFVQAALFAD